MESVIPLFCRSSGVSPWWVVVMGWVARLSGPPRLAAMVKSSRPSTNLVVSSPVPSISRVSIPPNPDICDFARSC